MKKDMEYLKLMAFADDYSNRNYEIAVSFMKAIDLMIKDKKDGLNNYYEVYLCPIKNPNIDAYIICTTSSHRDYALQIKASSKYNPAIKDVIYNGRHKYPLNPDNYLLMTWKKFKTYKSFNYQPNVKDESILELLHELENQKKDFPQEIEFLENCLQKIREATYNNNEVNWIELKRLQAQLLGKNKLEEAVYLP